MRLRVLVVLSIAVILSRAPAGAQILDTAHSAMPERLHPGELPSPQLNAPIRMAVSWVGQTPALKLRLSDKQQSAVKYTQSHTDSSVVITLSATWEPIAPPGTIYLPPLDSLYLVFCYHSDSAVFLLVGDSAALPSVRTLREGPFIRLGEQTSPPGSTSQRKR